MAHHRSAEKRHRQSLARNARNRYFIATLKTFLKKARKSVEAKEENAQNLVRKASAFIQHVASKGIIHRNKASRLVSRLAKFYNKSL